MHLSHIPLCTAQNINVHISVLYGALKWNRWIVGFVKIVYCSGKDITPPGLAHRQDRLFFLKFACQTFRKSRILQNDRRDQAALRELNSACRSHFLRKIARQCGMSLLWRPC